MHQWPTQLLTNVWIRGGQTCEGKFQQCSIEPQWSCNFSLKTRVKIKVQDKRKSIEISPCQLFKRAQYAILPLTSEGLMLPEC